MSRSSKHRARNGSRLFVAALLLYQFYFFNVLLPGHTRGSITLDGRHHPDACCCCCGETQPTPADAGSSKNAPSQKDRENCAICNLAVRILPAPVLDLSLPPLAFLRTVDREIVCHPASVAPIATYLGRAPPSEC